MFSRLIENAKRIKMELSSFLPRVKSKEGKEATFIKTFWRPGKKSGTENVMKYKWSSKRQEYLNQRTYILICVAYGCMDTGNMVVKT